MILKWNGPSRPQHHAWIFFFFFRRGPRRRLWGAKVQPEGKLLDGRHRRGDAPGSGTWPSPEGAAGGYVLTTVHGRAPSSSGARGWWGSSSLKAKGNGVGKDMRRTTEGTQFPNGSSRFEVAPATTIWRAAGLEALTPRQRLSADGSYLAGPLFLGRCVFSCACFALRAGIRMTNFTKSQISSHDFRGIRYLWRGPLSLLGGQLVFTTICTCFPTTPCHAPTTPPRTPTAPPPHLCARSRPRDRSVNDRGSRSE